MGREKKKRGGRRDPVREPRLTVAIATFPDASAEGVTLANDVRLAKAALLYADEVELVSPGVELLASMAGIAEATWDDPLALMELLDEQTVTALNNGEPMPDGWRDMVKLAMTMTDDQWNDVAELTGISLDEQRAQIAKIRDGAKEHLTELRETIERMMVDSGAHELLPAIASGVLTVAPVVTSAASYDPETLTRLYVEKLKSLVRSRDRHLLFDEQASALARALIDEGHVTPGGLTIRRAGETAVGAGMVTRLPALEAAPMSELLDLRTDLSDPLVRYRRGVGHLAQRLRADPLGKDVEGELDDLYRNEVEPALVDLREALVTHSFVREVARHLAADPLALVVGSVGSSIIAGWASLGEVDGLLALAPVAIGSAKAVVEGASAGKEKRQELGRGEFFYLYELDRRLS